MTWTRFIPFPLGTSFRPSTRSQVHRGTTSSPIVINDWFSHSNKSLSYSFTVLLAQHWAVYITEMRTRVLKLLARPPRGICTFNNEFYRFLKYHEPFPLIFYDRGRRWNLPIDLHLSILNATFLYDSISLTKRPMFVHCNCTATIDRFEINLFDASIDTRTLPLRSQTISRKEAETRVSVHAPERLSSPYVRRRLNFSMDTNFLSVPRGRPRWNKDNYRNVTNHDRRACSKYPAKRRCTLRSRVLRIDYISLCEQRGMSGSRRRYILYFFYQDG